MKISKKIKSEKGITGINIAVSIVILFIFVTLIAIMLYNITSSTKEIELQSKAMVYAVEEIEYLKTEGFNNLPEENTDEEEILDEEGKGTSFYKKILIEDYADKDEENLVPGIVKKVTVQIKYIFKGQEKSEELSTVLTKEN